jgi:cyclopropane fatty-acyl-phospholipid synthase-like methyltransferase
VTETSLESLTLGKAPTRFFMTLRDIAFWVRSARADATLARFRTSHEVGPAFDRLYGATHDPYGATLPQFRYQRQKYETLVSMLPLRQYREVLDIGCGLGVFARSLAPHAEQVLGIDISAEAVRGARLLSRDHANIEYRQADLASFAGEATRYDLIVLADTLYYMTPLTDAVVDAIARQMAGLLAPGGLLMLVNHFFFAIDPPSRMTRRIHDRFIAAPELALKSEHRRAFYLASIFEGR